METDGEMKNGYEPCTGHLLAINTSLKEVMLYLGDIYPLSFNSQNLNASHPNKAKCTYGQQWQSAWTSHGHFGCWTAKQSLQEL